MEKNEWLFQAEVTSHRDPQYVYDWLESCSRLDKDQLRFQDEIYQTEIGLMERNDPLIDLGLAKYGRTGSVLSDLYEKGSELVRVAALSNSVYFETTLEESGWINDAAIESMIKEIEDETSDLFTALCLNPRISDRHIKLLLKRDGPFSTLSERQLICAVYFFSDNKSVCLDYEDNPLDELDGWSRSIFYERIEGAWNLVGALTVNQLSANYLHKFLSKLPKESHRLKNIDVLIDRWRIDEEGSTYGLPPSFLLRALLVDLKPLKDNFREHTDVAFRASYLRRFWPHTFPDWVAYAQDNIECADFLIENEHILSDEGELESLCAFARSSMDGLSFIRLEGELNRRTKKIPLGDKIDNQQETLNKVHLELGNLIEEVGYLKNADKIASLATELADIKDDVSKLKSMVGSQVVPDLEAIHKSSINIETFLNNSRISSSLMELSEKLGGLRVKVSTVGTTAIFLILIGLVMTYFL
jgi:hypothetical protein